MIDDIKEHGRLALHRLILVVIPEDFTFHRRFYAGSLFYYFLLLFFPTITRSFLGDFGFVGKGHHLVRRLFGLSGFYLA